MLKRSFLLLVLSGSCFAASPDPVKATFGGGILGNPWGSSLTAVIGVYSQGDHLPAVTPGCRAYLVKDGQEFLGIPRQGRGVLFGFDRQNHVAIASVAFDFERRAELHSTLISLFGVPMVSSNSGEKTQYGWRSPDGMTASVTEFGEGPQRMVWLSVSVPGYKAVKDGC